jgi:hypothetical protein
MDAMLLYSETPNLHTHTLKGAIVNAADYDRELTFGVFRRTIARRLHLLDPLRYLLVDIPWKLHHPMWLETARSTSTTTSAACTCPLRADGANSTR